MQMNQKVIDIQEMQNSFKMAFLIYLVAYAKHELLTQSTPFQWRHLTDSKQTDRKIKELKATIYFLSNAKQNLGIRKIGQELKTQLQLFFYKVAKSIHEFVPQISKKNADRATQERLQNIANNLMKFIQKLLWENSQRRIADLFNHPHRRRTG